MSLSDRQRHILELARTVWENQHEHDLDTVDGTFFWRGCRWELLVELLEEAANSPGSGHGRLRNAIPGFGEGQGGRRVDEFHIPMRGAVTSVMTNIVQLPPGETEGGHTWRRKGVVRARIRNAEWVGADVAEVLHEAWGRYMAFVTDDHWDQHVEFLGVSPPEHVEMDMNFGPDREGRLIDISEADTFTFEPGETRVRVAAKPTPDWEFDPRIEVEVTAPPPPKAVIAAWFDEVAINTYQWPSQLKGAKNAQDVATAIRTWTIALLMRHGLPYYDAIRELDRLDLAGFRGGAQSKFSRDRALLIRRVPEAERFLRTSRAGDTLSPE